MLGRAARVLGVGLVAGCEPNPAFDGPIDGGGTGDCTPRAQVSGLHAAWSTPNQIRWAWDVDLGSTDTLQEFRLELASSEAALLAGGDDVRVVTRAENPELGFLELPGTMGADPVRATVVDALEPDTDYAARLLAIDDFGCTHATAVALEHTPPPPVGDITVFADTLPGYVLPDNLRLLDDPTRAYGGSAFLEYRPQDDPECEGVTPVCWQNLRIQGMAIPLALGNAYDKTAYVELALAADTANTPYWANAWLRFHAVCSACVDCASEPCTAEQCPTCSGYYDAWTVRPSSGYRVLQWPLRAFLRGDAPIPAVESDAGLFGFALGAAWDPGAIIRIDEIHVRY
jgi:hypothetical protein